MKLDVEMRRAINDAVAGLPPDAALARRDAIFAAGYRMGLERAAKACDAERGVIQARLDAGKGRWPQQDYVRDDTWNRWHGERAVADSLGRRIREMAHD